MQLVYRWNIGNQILEASLQKITQFLAQPSLFARETEGEESICVNMDVKRMKVTSNEQSSSSSSNQNQNQNQGSTTTSSKGKKNKKTKMTKKGKQTSPRDEKDDEKDQMEVNEGTQLHVSLSQALSILQAVVDDSISQSTAYSPELLTTTLTVLEPLLPALQQYAFPLSAPSTTSVTPATSVLEVFFNLIALKVRIEMFQAVSASLEANAEMMKTKARANEQGVGEGGLPEMRVNPLVGKVPTTLNELRILLSKQLVTINSMGM